MDANNRMLTRNLLLTAQNELDLRRAKKEARIINVILSDPEGMLMLESENLDSQDSAEVWGLMDEAGCEFDGYYFIASPEQLTVLAPKLRSLGFVVGITPPVLDRYGKFDLQLPMTATPQLPETAA